MSSSVCKCAFHLCRTCSVPITSTFLLYIWWHLLYEPLTVRHHLSPRLSRHLRRRQIDANFRQRVEAKRSREARKQLIARQKEERTQTLNDALITAQKMIYVCRVRAARSTYKTEAWTWTRWSQTCARVRLASHNYCRRFRKLDAVWWTIPSCVAITSSMVTATYRLNDESLKNKYTELYIWANLAVLHATHQHSRLSVIAAHVSRISFKPGNTSSYRTWIHVSKRLPQTFLDRMKEDYMTVYCWNQRWASVTMLYEYIFMSISWSSFTTNM